MRTLNFASFLLLGFILPELRAQNVGINTTGSAPHSSAGLDIDYTNRGILIPRVALTAANSASPITSPETSLLIYNTATTGTAPNNVFPGYYYWNGSSWSRLDNSNAGDWRLTGNTGIDSTVNYLGTTDGRPLILRTNGIERLRLAATTANSTFLRLTGSTSNQILYNTAGVAAPSVTTRSAGTKVVWYPQVSGTEVDYATGIESFTLWQSIPGNTSSYQHRFYGGTQRLLDIRGDNRTLFYGAGDNVFTAPTSGFVTLNVEGSMFMPSGQSLWLGNTADVGDRLRLHQTGADSYIDFASGFLQFRTGFTNRVRITSDGRVGIGTISPIHILDVNGRMHINNGVIQRGGPAITTTDDLGLYSRVASSAIRYVTNNAPHVWFTDDGAGTTVRMQLDASGNLHVPTGHLRVGNPSAPASTPGASLAALYSTGDEGFAGFQGADVCGGAGANWGLWFPASATGLTYARYDNGGTRSRKLLYTPWMWVPTGATNLIVYLHYNNTLESNSDGVFLEYSTNGTTWIKVTSFSGDGYNASTNGSNTTCNANDAQMAWTNNNWRLSTTSSLGVAGTWIRFRLVGFENESNSSGHFDMYRFLVEINLPSIGGAFAPGNIYAQNNVYAGSNVLLGDLAEYFTVSGRSEAGDVIALDPVMPDRYCVAKGAYNPHVVGIHSANPTLTLNDPNSGIPVALRGRVPVKVCSQNGPIKPGDMLTVSDMSGVAMKATKAGYVIGRALEHFNGEGQGKILCLVENAWYNPNESNARISSGSLEFPKGKTEFVVLDDKVNSKTKVFITFSDDVGGPYWVKKEKGKFVLKISRETQMPVMFDYLVEYGEAEQEENKTSKPEILSMSVEKPADFETGGWQYDPVKKIYWRNVQEPTPEGYVMRPFPEIKPEDLIPPPIPENPEIPGYIIDGVFKPSKIADRYMSVKSADSKK